MISFQNADDSATFVFIPGCQLCENKRSYFVTRNAMMGHLMQSIQSGGPLLKQLLRERRRPTKPYERITRFELETGAICYCTSLCFINKMNVEGKVPVHSEKIIKPTVLLPRITLRGQEVFRFSEKMTEVTRTSQQLKFNLICTTSSNVTTERHFDEAARTH